MLLFVIITFSLFWVVIKNNLIYCVRTGTVDGGGLFFPSAINQLFTGLYFMQICLTGLFFLVRDANDGVACDAQGIIMAVVLVLTALYHIWLTVHLGPLFKYAPVRLDAETQALLADYETKRSIESSGVQDLQNSGELELDHKNKELASLPANSPTLQTNSSTQIQKSPPESRPSFRQNPSNAASHRSQEFQAQQRAEVETAKRILNRLNQPLDETRLAQLEDKLEQSEAHRGNALFPRRRDIEAQMINDPISKIIMQHNDELENLDPEERDMLISIAFTHPVLRAAKPCVWIPMDNLGISDDEVRRTKEFSEDVSIENRGAYFNEKLKVQVDRPPPDMSQFALIMAEL
jgi:hypothetical protein